MIWNLLKQKAKFFSSNYRNEIQHFLAHIPGNLYWKTWGGSYLGCNAGTLQLLGLEEKDFIDKTDQQLWPEHATTFREYEEKIVSRQNINSFRITVTLKNDEKKLSVLVALYSLAREREE